MRTLEQMKETAQRQLDGMIVNRDVMAQDVLTLVNSIESFRQKSYYTAVYKFCNNISGYLF
jgi:hypothetical protein